MKIDRAIDTFMEKYDSTAMEYIEDLSKNFGMNANRIPFLVFNINEGFDRFDEYLKGYAKYKCDNVNNEEATSQEDIRESVSNFIEDHVFTEKYIQYKEIPTFVKGYVTGVNKILETVDIIKRDMIDAGVEMEAVGDVNDFVDEFMDVLDESFNHVMNNILLASGYTNKYNPRTTYIEEKPVFL